MAKNFPYFKFVATEWLTGDIVYEDFETQGLFINICATYWQRNGQLSLEDLQKRYKNTDRLAKITDRFISVKDGFISVKFLDEQLIDAGHISKVNSENGSKGGRPKALQTLENKPTANRPLSDRKAKKSKEEEEVNKKKESFKNDLSNFLCNYEKSMLNNFYSYWTEPNKSKTKLRFEMEKTWDLNLRLKNWASRERDFKPKQANNTNNSGLTAN